MNYSLFPPFLHPLCCNEIAIFRVSVFYYRALCTENVKSVFLIKRDCLEMFLCPPPNPDVIVCRLKAELNLQFKINL